MGNDDHVAEMREFLRKMGLAEYVNLRSMLCAQVSADSYTTVVVCYSLEQKHTPAWKAPILFRHES
jgi:hypothetical protein